MMWKYFLPFCGLSFYFLDSIFGAQLFLILRKSNLSIFFLCCLCFGVRSKKIAKSKVMIIYPHGFFKSLCNHSLVSVEDWFQNTL